MSGPMMKCGHAANATRTDRATGEERPSCVICVGIAPGADEVDDTPPDLTTRTARCGYYSKTPTGRNREGPCGRGQCRCERPSSEFERLAFFEHKPDSAHDAYYCGCWGWD